jgi:hypothetical protein
LRLEQEAAEKLRISAEAEKAALKIEQEAQ